MRTPSEQTTDAHAHNLVGYELSVMIHAQVDRREYETKFNAPRARLSDGSSYIPDVMVVPRSLTQSIRGRSDVLESYPPPLPLVVEVWSPSTGQYDVDTKFPGYQERGDLEVWRLHPYERSLTRWIRQPDGGYVQTLVTGGTVTLHALPAVAIDLDELFGLID